MNRFYTAIAVCLLSLISICSRAQPPHWTSASNAGGRSADFGSNVVADAAGNRYVLGQSYSDTLIAGTIRLPLRDTVYGDLVLLKYDRLGIPLWAKNLAYGNKKFQGGMSIDPSGSLYVAGGFSDSIRFGNHVLRSRTANSNPFLAKLDSSGSCIWLKGADSADFSRGTNVMASGDGNVLVTGFFSRYIRFGATVLTATTNTNNLFAASYDSAGNFRWVKQLHSQNQCSIAGIGSDAAGNTYLGGYFNDTLTIGGATLPSYSGTRYNLAPFLAKLDGNGNVVWVKNPAGPSGDVHVSGMAADRQGNLVLAGTFTDSLRIGGRILRKPQYSSGNAFVARFDPAGNFRWASTPDTSYSVIHLYAICLDLSSSIYLTGGFNADSVRFGSFLLRPRSNGFEPFIVKYDSSGSLQWAVQSDGGDQDVSMTGLWAGNGKLFLSGTVRGSYNRFGPFTIGNHGYHDLFLASLDSPSGVERETSVERLQPYPNPTTGIATLQSPLLSGAAVTVCNALGACVYTGVSGGTTHRIDLSQQPEGLYFVRISGARSAAACTVLVQR